MGATNCPETPRQKMITMMYLVYTAMLALNVSAEVVQGFKSVASAMHESNKNITAKLDDTYTNFDDAMKNSPDKVREMYMRAQEIKRLSGEITTFIDSMQFTFIGTKVASNVKYKDPGTGREWELQLRDEMGNSINDNVKTALDSIGYAWFTDKQLEDNHAPAQFFIGGDVKNPDPNLGAIQIKNKIIEFKQKVNEALGEDSSHVKMALNVDDGYNKEGHPVSWEVLNFNEVITGAALVTLTRLKAETMNAEFDAVNMLYKKVSKGDMTFDQIAMISRPKATYILQGGTYETKINVGAYDSRQKFTATVNGQQLTSGDSGSVVYRTVCNNLGPQRINGVAYVTSPDGGTKEYPINDVYFVAKPAGVISLDNMQVLYAGIENPLTASAAGVDTRNLRVSIAEGQGKLTPGEGEGHYNITPSPGCRKIVLALDATIDKKQTTMGRPVFKVKEIPDPIITVGGFKNGDKVARATLASGATVAARANPSFEFKIPRGSIRVMSVEVSVGNRAPVTSNSSTLDPEVLNSIKRANRGEKVYVTAKVMMPDGKPREAYCILTLNK